MCCQHCHCGGGAWRGWGVAHYLLPPTHNPTPPSLAAAKELHPLLPRSLLFTPLCLSTLPLLFRRLPAPFAAPIDWPAHCTPMNRSAAAVHKLTICFHSSPPGQVPSIRHAPHVPGPCVTLALHSQLPGQGQPPTVQVDACQTTTVVLIRMPAWSSSPSRRWQRPVEGSPAAQSADGVQLPALSAASCQSCLPTHPNRKSTTPPLPPPHPPTHLHRGHGVGIVHGECLTRHLAKLQHHALLRHGRGMAGRA